MSARNQWRYLTLFPTIAGIFGQIAPAGAATISPSGAYHGHVTTICQTVEQTSNTTIIQSSKVPLYSTVTIAISPTNHASFASAQNLVTNNLISSSVSNNGSIYESIARFNFKPSSTGAASGTFTGYIAQTSGSLVLSGTSSSSPGDFVFGAQNTSGTYSATATTLTLSFGKKPTVFQAIYFKTSPAGVPTDIDIVGITDNGQQCTATGSFSSN